MFKIINKIQGLFYGFYVFFCFSGGGFFFKIKKHKNPKGNIILIPGIMLNSLGFRPMGSFLSKLGYNVYIPKIGWNIWNVDIQAEKVNQFWQKQKINSKQPLFVVGHSMGGLIAHFWLNNYKIKPQKLITLGTPFLGSSSIYWGPWYFFPASKWIKPKTNLDEYIFQKTDFEQINVATDDDSLVKIESGLPHQIQSQKILLKKYGGHSALEIRKKAFERVGELIKKN